MASGREASSREAQHDLRKIEEDESESALDDNEPAADSLFALDIHLTEEDIGA